MEHINEFITNKRTSDMEHLIKTLFKEIWKLQREIFTARNKKRTQSYLRGKVDGKKEILEYLGSITMVEFLDEN